MKNNIIGHILLIAFVFSSGVFFYYSIETSENRLLNAALMTFVMLALYFYGKGSLFYYLMHKRIKYKYAVMLRVLVSVLALLMPLIANKSIFGIENVFLFLLPLLISLVLGFDAGSYIDGVLEQQVYKDIPQEEKSIVLNLFMYILLAVVFIYFFQQLDGLG